MPPPSLLQLCTSTAIRNVKCQFQVRYTHTEHFLTVFLDLNDIGNVPYSLARPFLLKIESPEKLVSGSSCLHIVGSVC
jgi:elongin-A